MQQVEQPIFMQLGFNLSNGVTDTLESSSILIYLIQETGIYTQMDTLIKRRVLVKWRAFAKLIKTDLIWGEEEVALCEFNLHILSHKFWGQHQIIDVCGNPYTTNPEVCLQWH